MSLLNGSKPSFDPALIPTMRRLWEDARDLSASEIGARLSVTRNIVIGQANRRGWKRPVPEPVVLKQSGWKNGARRADVAEAYFTHAELVEMRGLWDAGEMLVAIRRRFGVAESTIVAIAKRQEWLSRPSQDELAAPEPSTIFTRCDALNAKLDAVLAETRPYVEDRPKTMLDARRAA